MSSISLQSYNANRISFKDGYTEMYLLTETFFDLLVNITYLSR